ncbi:MAG: hypothetical protein AUK35_02290 [Zetaproteobacteria bacterium CG2_30_46_52]|nr:MAG: hypothetical protein AUK35_02290 [Zetaproteobacteria bacterium CG2_30_46_52]
MQSQSKLHVLVIGDVIHSAGTRSYVREILKHTQHLSPQFAMFQFRLDTRPTNLGYVEVDDFPSPLRMAGGIWMFKLLPRPIYRLYERLVMLFYLLGLTFSMRKHDVLVASGVLDFLHILRPMLPRDIWWLKLGVIEEEGTGTLRYRLRKWIERQHARFPHRMFVSKPMGKFLDSEYGKAKGKELILPCLVDLQRFPPVADKNKLRKSLGLADKFVVAYVGTASHWQCVEETVALFKQILQQRPNSFFWVFTPDKEAFASLMVDVPKESWRVEFRPHHELAGLLPAADIACLLRRKALLNHVSSPLKFPEYLSCGLPVLIGEEVGQYSAMVKDKALGVLINPEDKDAWQVSLTAMFALLDNDSNVSQRCLDAAYALSWQGYGTKLDSLLQATNVTGHQG